MLSSLTHVESRRKRGDCPVSDPPLIGLQLRQGNQHAVRVHGLERLGHILMVEGEAICVEGDEPLGYACRLVLQVQVVSTIFEVRSKLWGAPYPIRLTSENGKRQHSLAC